MKNNQTNEQKTKQVGCLLSMWLFPHGFSMWVQSLECHNASPHVLPEVFPKYHYDPRTKGNKEEEERKKIKINIHILGNLEGKEREMSRLWNEGML